MSVEDYLKGSEAEIVKKEREISQQWDKQICKQSLTDRQIHTDRECDTYLQRERERKHECVTDKIILREIELKGYERSKKLIELCKKEYSNKKYFVWREHKQLKRLKGKIKNTKER